jgi:hypothetical protein
MFDINRLSTSQLVALYNSGGGTPVNRFSDKTTGIKRLKARMKELDLVPNEDGTELITAKKAAPAPAPEKSEKAKKEPAARKPRGMYFVFPFLDEIKPVRPGTNRAVLYDLLSRPEGATFEECVAATWGKKKDMPAEKQIKTTYEAVRLLHYYCGYSMRMSEGGKIHLKTKK